MSLAGFVPHAGAQEPPTEWTLTLGAQESHEFSAVFNGVEQEGLIQDSVNAQLAMQTRMQRSHLGFFGRVGYNFYRKTDSQDQITFGAGLAWDYHGQRFGSSLSFSIDRGLSPETLSTLGVLAPGVTTDSIDTRWNFNYRTSPRTIVSTSLSYNYIWFESGGAIPGSQIVLPQSPFREQFSPLPDATAPPADPDTIELPNPEQSILNILATEGFSSPTTRSQWANAMFGLSHRTSESTTLGFDLGAGYRTIDDGTQSLGEGSESGFRAWSQHRVGMSSDFSAYYEYHRTLVQEPANTVQSLVGGYSYSRPGRSLALRLHGGASYFQAEPLGDMLTPVVDAMFSAGLSRSTTFAAAYRRQFAQSLGFGSTHLIDYAYVTLTQQFGSKVDASLLAGASLSRDPLIEDSRYDAVQAGATLSYRIAESFQVGTSYSVLEQTDTSGTEISETRRQLWTVFASFTTHWR
jgi:hypothetical protein